MSTREIVNGKFTAKRMNSFNQSFVLKRLLPVVAGMTPIIQGYMQAKSGTTPEISNLVNFGEIGELISSLKDDDIQFIYDKCLNHTYLNINGKANTTPLLNNGVCIVDLSLSDLIQIVIENIALNFEDFFK